MSESAGFKARGAVNPFGGATTVFSSSSIQFEMLSHSIKEGTEIVSDEGLRGTRSRDISRVAQGNIKVAGDIVLQPNVLELETFMPFIMGTASSGGTYALADTLADMYVMIDNVTEVNTYLLRINQAKFECDKDDKKLKLTLSCVGKTMTQGSTFTSGIPAIDTTTRPYMFYDAGQSTAITIASVAYQIAKFELMIDNGIVPTYMSGQTATDLEPTDRKVMLGLQTKYTSTRSPLESSRDLSPSSF
jgi:hypothetical protein